MRELSETGSEESNPGKFTIDDTDEEDQMPSFDQTYIRRDIEAELWADKSVCGRIIFFLFKFWQFVLMFEIFVKVISAYAISAVSQLLFVQSSSNPEQGVLVGFVTFSACYLGTTILYFLFYLCFAERDVNSKKKALKITHPSRIIYFALLCVLLGVSLYSITLIHKNCFDEDGNYKKPIFIDEENAPLIFCDIKSIVLG